jgi:Alginate lyase
VNRSRHRWARRRTGNVLVAPLAACMLLLGCGSPAPNHPATVPSSTNDQGSGVPQAPEKRTNCRYPGDVLDLRGWKLTLPIGTPDKPTQPEEIRQPELADFEISPWFQPTADCTGVAFRAPIDAPTTSGSHYPRSELREMTADGSENASWSSTSGTHTMTVTEAFTGLPQGKPHLVGAQIHDDDDDITVFRLEGTNLYVTDGDNPNYKLITDNYVLGTKFEAKFVVSAGVVQAFYNGQLQATLAKNFSDAYFKAGAYTQANCERAAPCTPGNYCETVIYHLAVTHS